MLEYKTIIYICPICNRLRSIRTVKEMSYMFDKMLCVERNRHNVHNLDYIIWRT